MLSPQQIKKLSLITIYRIIIKNLPSYPSSNRLGILQAVKEQFHDKKNITDEKLIKQQRKKAQIGLRNVLFYVSKIKQGKQKSKIQFGQMESMNTANDFVIF